MLLHVCIRTVNFVVACLFLFRKIHFFCVLETRASADQINNLLIMRFQLIDCCNSYGPFVIMRDANFIYLYLNAYASPWYRCERNDESLSSCCIFQLMYIYIDDVCGNKEGWQVECIGQCRWMRSTHAHVCEVVVWCAAPWFITATKIKKT